MRAAGVDRDTARVRREKDLTLPRGLHIVGVSPAAGAGRSFQREER